MPAKRANGDARYFLTPAERSAITKAVEQSLVEHKKDAPYPTNFFNKKGKLAYKNGITDATLARSVSVALKNPKISEQHVYTVRRQMFGKLDQAALQKMVAKRKYGHLKANGEKGGAMWDRLRKVEARLAQIEDYLTRTSVDQLGGGFNAQGENSNDMDDFTPVSVAN